MVQKARKDFRRKSGAVFRMVIASRTKTSPPASRTYYISRATLKPMYHAKGSISFRSDTAVTFPKGDKVGTKLRSTAEGQRPLLSYSVRHGIATSCI